MTLHYTTFDDETVQTINEVSNIDYSNFLNNILYYFTRKDGSTFLHQVENVNWINVEE